MPVDILDLTKLISGIILFIIPGYLWTFFILKDLKILERIVFGFVLSLGVICCGLFIIDVLLRLPLTPIKVSLLLAIYAASGIIFFSYTVYKSGLSRFHFSFLKQPKIFLLTAILAFATFMIFLPHLSYNYYLPFHVDEWIHWADSRAVMEQGSSVFIDPYTGNGTTRSLESGFHYITACLKWITGINFNTIFVFMPSIIAIFASLTAFNIGERSERKFGLEAALLIPFIPTLCRIMGPSFYVPLTLGLLFLIFIMWLVYLKKIRTIIFIPLFIWCAFLIHPPTALACIIFTVIYGFVLLLEKEFKFTILIIGFSLIPIATVLILASQWGYALQQVIDAFFGGKTFLEIYDLPQIWPSFEHLGVITWIL